MIGNPDFLQDSHLKREHFVYFPQASLQGVLTKQESFIIKDQFTLNRLGIVLEYTNIGNVEKQAKIIGGMDRL